MKIGYSKTMRNLQPSLLLTKALLRHNNVGRKINRREGRTAH